MAFGCKNCKYNDKVIKVCNLNHSDYYAAGLQCSEFEEGGKEYVFYDKYFYQTHLDKFVDTGLWENPDPKDALCQYLDSLFDSPFIKLQVLGDQIKARIFRDLMIRFMTAILDRMKFKYQMAQSDMRRSEEIKEWSDKKKDDGWQGLVQELQKFSEYGFPSPFYKQQLEDEHSSISKQDLWEKLSLDWQQAIHNKLSEEKKREVINKEEEIKKRIGDYTQQIPEYLQQHNIEYEQFAQAWGMMNGVWNESDFQRLMKVVRLQKEYPDIVKIANKMGRISDATGSEWMSLAQGQSQSIEHSSHSDILGVTMGNDINALLPLELAQYMDEDTENIFYQRFMTNRLQVFRFKSEIVQPARNLQTKPTVRKGPMIVCVDTSGSMKGKPEQIANSALLKVLDIANSQRRDCYLIGFSVSINPIDVKRETYKVMDFFAKASSGDTNATRLLEKIFSLLETSPSYMNADILWVTDFRIPPVSAALIEKMRHYQSENTRFYGLQIGMAEHDWHKHFDEIIRLGYTPPRKL